MNRFSWLVMVLVATMTPTAPAAERILEGKLYHLRVGAEREWAEFPLKPDGASLTVRFKATVKAIRRQDC